MRTPLLLVFSALLATGCQDDAGAVRAGHVHGPHDGLVTPFEGGGTSGFLELKLHDDKGDIELWIGRDRQLATPFRLPADATPEIEFLDRGKRIRLAVRNRERNEDEAGVAQMVAGETGYFIYPGDRGEDSSWLTGKAFRAPVVVRFRKGTTEFESRRTVLQPHAH